ncbi:hypothetical protein [uncultured Desulfosarcina sp.]|uniref:hypothetical protein n=1 Tax=uncultured Desulfosarcina sp. TaxID=218289 RepID=UPI0029C987B3|nr:hypothetical protein [uncultured Desulfosarcina sp.]
MPAWSEPQDLKTWMVRGLSLRGSVLFLSVLAILISEVRFSWVEVLVGRYLAVTNSHRPESGSVWEQGRLKQVATQTLEQMVTRQLTAQREAREATSLTQLIDGLSTSQGTMISAAQFKTLYSQIPDVAARTLFSPILMLRISAEKSWDRVYMERENGQVGIYLLDRGNNVLSYTTLTDQQLKSTGTEQPVLEGTLDGQPEFSGRIYPADRFFMALDTLSPETQRGVLSQPGALLAAEGTPVRVGISDEVNADMIRIGVEMDTTQGPQILLTMGQEWAVWQVRMLLEPRLSKPPASKSLWPLRREER